MGAAANLKKSELSFRGERACRAIAEIRAERAYAGIADADTLEAVGAHIGRRIS